MKYTELVRRTRAVFRQYIPQAQVSVDIPWSPYDVDGRSYDWRGLGDAVDLLFVMVYDVQSQIIGRCVAAANSPIDAVHKSAQQWRELGLDLGKMVLGLPWYGYDYPCEGDHISPQTDLCPLKLVPFRNISCSDAAGAQVCYSDIMARLRQGGNTTAVHMDRASMSPYFNYYDKEEGRVHQVWFDTPESLKVKYMAARRHGFRGLGIWNLDCLDYCNKDPEVQAETREMWETLKVFASPNMARTIPMGTGAESAMTSVINRVGQQGVE